MESTHVTPNPEAKPVYESVSLKPTNAGKVMQIFPIIFGIIFCLVLAVIIFSAVQVFSARKSFNNQYNKVQEVIFTPSK